MISRMSISDEIKLKCIELYNQGLSSSEIYEQYFSKIGHQSYASFRTSLRRWRKSIGADSKTLHAGTYENFIAHGATVQVNRSGEIVQAWIKQSVGDDQLSRILESIKENTTPVAVEVHNSIAAEKMLEIPLYDMHFPLSDHTGTMLELLSLLDTDYWRDINIIIGQDLFHNDDFRGRTTSGRPIEKLDMVEAWDAAHIFWYTIIKKCLEKSNHVKVIYSKGNHDETLAWAFIQMLKAMFPTVEFDDTLHRRKCIYWDGCFVGITHGSETKSMANDLRGQFTIDFPREFADARVREIHAGHLHHEVVNDLYGVLIRRLCTAAPKDEWSDDEGYTGSHRRFVIFEWIPNRLRSIYYIEDTKI